MDNENQFTKEELEELLALNNEKSERISVGGIRCLIRSLLAEMAIPSVYDVFPEWADEVELVFRKKDGSRISRGTVYQKQWKITQ